MLKDKALKNVQAFFTNCDELLNGRFIFAENIIAKILQNISDSDEIYALIAECMKNFNFDREFNRAKVKLPTKDGYFVMPESRAVVLPLVFCILVDIRDKKIDLHDFLNNYFKSESMDEFQNFAQTLIIPFKNAVAYCFDMEVPEVEPKKDEKFIEQVSLSEVVENPAKSSEEIKKEEQQEIEKQTEIIKEKMVDKNTKQFFDSITILCNQMLQEIEVIRRIKPDLKDDSIYILNNMIDCCNEYDLRNISAYIVAVNYMFKPIKPLRFLCQELKNQLEILYTK